MYVALIVLSVLSLLGAIWLTYWTIRGMQADVAVTGTYLFPVFNWCSARHLVKAVTAGLLLASALFGVLLAFLLITTREKKPEPKRWSLVPPSYSG